MTSPKRATCFRSAKSLSLSDGKAFCQYDWYGNMTLLSSFVGVVILNFVDPALLLAIYGFFCSFFCLLVSQLPGYGGVGCIFGLFFFESICYPCVFTLGTKNLGKHTKKGSGLIVMVSSSHVLTRQLTESMLGCGWWSLVPIRAGRIGRFDIHPSVISCPDVRIHCNDVICYVSADIFS